MDVVQSIELDRSGGGIMLRKRFEVHGSDPRLVHWCWGRLRRLGGEGGVWIGDIFPRYS